MEVAVVLLEVTGAGGYSEAAMVVNKGEEAVTLWLIVMCVCVVINLYFKFFHIFQKKHLVNI